MITLDPHNGDFGTAAWVECSRCTHSSAHSGWFAIRAGEAHLIDRATRKHYHADCAVQLVRLRQARFHRTEAA